MRILYLNPCGQMGGAETSLVELLAGLRTTAPECELWLLLGEDGPLADKARGMDVQVKILPFPNALARLGDAGTRGPSTVWRLSKAARASALYSSRFARVLRAIRPDVIHTNGLKMHLLGAWMRPKGIPVIWHVHDYVRKRPFMRWLLRLSYRRCSAAVVNSKSVGADLTTLVPKLSVKPIYNAVDSNRFTPIGVKTDLDAISGLTPATPGTVRVGLVSTFARWKGHKVFLQSLAQLPADAQIRGYIIGGPIYQTDGSQWSLHELRQEAAWLGIASRVGFTGFLDDTAGAMRALDVVVHASTEPEPFGMVIIEAMASGRPVIASEAGGARELFSDGENALAHSPGDSDSLATQILRLAADEDLRTRLGRAGRATAVGLYDRNRLAIEMLTTYRQVTMCTGHTAARLEPARLSPTRDETCLTK